MESDFFIQVNKISLKYRNHIQQSPKVKCVNFSAYHLQGRSPKQNAKQMKCK